MTTVAVLDGDDVFAGQLVSAITRATRVVRVAAQRITLDDVPETVLGRRADILVVDAREVANRRVFAEVRRRHDRVQIIAIVSEADATAVPAVVAGAAAVIARKDALRMLPAAIAALSVDLCAMPRVLLDTVLERSGFPRDVPAGDRLGGLTVREREVLALLMSGQDQRQIATSLGLSVHTVRSHVKRILMKLDAHSSLEAAAVAFRSGLQPQDLGAPK